MVVTSDHGIAPIPEYLAAKSLLPDPDASYRFRPNAARAEVEKRLREKYFRSVKAPPDFAGFITAWNTKTHPFVYLHEQAASAAGAKSNSALAASVAGVIESLPGVARVDTLAQREQLASRLDGLDQRVFRAWDRENGGDLQVTLSPHWVVSPYPVGTNHGSPYEYDTHVPLLLYGAGVHPGRYARAVSMVDIAPTLASIIGVPAPSASQGEALVEVLR
jgi:arylsulfatase A-like enzyme